MRILQIIQKKQLRGAEVFACQLSNQLINLGHEVYMVALLDGDAVMPFQGDIEVLHVDLSKRMYDFSGWKNLADAIEAFKPDIVQANAGDTLKYASLSKRIYTWKAKLVFRNANKMGDFIDARWKLWFNKWLLDPVDFVASVSEECRLDFIKTFNWEASQIATLPIGVNPFVAATHNPLAEQHWENRYPVLLSVAGFVKEKNHAGLIRIFSKVVKQYPGAVLILIGEGPLQTSVKQLTANAGLAEQVWFANRRQDVLDFMQNADVLVMPSLIEGLPGVILEAFVNRLPVVAYSVGGIPEVVQHKHTGYVISVGEEREFAAVVCDLVGSINHSASAIKDNAYALVQDAYTNETIAHRFALMYNNLIDVSAASSVG